MVNLIKRDPFDEFFRGFFVRPVEFAETEVPTIKLDVKEAPEEFTVQAELPGIRKEDIHVHVEGALVSISAERKEEKQVKEGERVLRTERHFGKVSRSFQLGGEVDDAHASAKFTDGLLELRLPKKAGVQPRKLTIA